MNPASGAPSPVGKKKPRLNRMIMGWVFPGFLILTLLLCISGIMLYTQSVFKQYDIYGATLLELNAQQYSGDDIRACIASGEMSEQLCEGLETANDIKEHSQVSYMYMLYFPDEAEPQDMRYVFYANTQSDRDAGIADSEINSRCGDEYTQAIYKRFYQVQFSAPGEAESGYVINRYQGVGTAELVMTGYLPILDSEGACVAILATDIYMTEIYSQVLTFGIGNLIVALLAFFLCSYGLTSNIRKNIVVPVEGLAESARDFIAQAQSTDEPSELHFLPVEVRRDTEIRDLSGEMTVMTDSLKDYMQNLKSITAERERIGAELNVATQIQASMLPKIFPKYSNQKYFRIFATMNPAKEVGGDFYDFFMVDQTHLAIVMADVSGKGVPAALFMVIGKTLIKDHTIPGRDLGEVFTRVNHLLCESNSEDMFITAFEAVIDLATGEMEYVNAGHETPFIAHAAQAYQPYKVRAGFVLAGMDGMRYRSGRMKLEDGDRIFQYTDGVTEATSLDKELYGMERLEAVLTRNTDKEPQDLLPQVMADIDAFVGAAPQFDDITMLCLEYHAGRGPDGKPESEES